MTEEERQLSAVYQQAVLQPPRLPTFDDIVEQARRRPTEPHRLGRWLPALAAACILLVVAAAGVWLVRDRAHAPVLIAKSPTVGSAPRSSAAPSAGTPKAVGPWSARALTNAPIGMTIASGPDAIFGREGADLVRFDPATGAVLVRAAANPDAFWPPLVTTNAFWQASVAHGIVSVQSLSPDTLQPLAYHAIAGASVPSPDGPQWSPVLAASPDGASLFLGNGSQLYALDAATGKVNQRAAVNGLIGAVAVSADGTKVYVAVNPQGSNAAELDLLAVRHNLSTVSQAALPGAPVTGLLVSSGGIWATFAGGHADSVWYLPSSNLSHGQVVSSGGGGTPSTVTLAGGAVWLGGPNTVACADPATGAVRDQAAVTVQLGQPRYFADIVLIDGHWLASYQTNGTTALATFMPPAACL